MSAIHNSPAAGVTLSRGRARIAMVVPMANTNLEPDMGWLRPEGVSLHVMRAGGYDLDAVPDLEQMLAFAQASLDEIIIALNAMRPDMIVYGCTSATLAHGPAFDHKLQMEIEDKCGVPAITAAGSIVEALNDLGVKRIGFCSPYVQALNIEAINFLTACGFESMACAYVGEDLGNYGQGELTPGEVQTLAVRADHVSADAVVLACTDMRAVEVIPQLESQLGKPVVASNQALMYVALKRLGVPPADAARGGKLFTLVAEANTCVPGVLNKEG